MMLTDADIDALWPEITLPQKVARREILRKGIEANNAKVLADLKPWQAAIASREPMTQQQQANIIHPDDDMATFIRTIASVERFHGIGE